MKNYLLTILYAVIWFVIGTACLLSVNEKWNLLGIVLYVIGSVLVALATWFSLWDKFIEKTQAMQYLFDSARHLDNERLNALLYAMGLRLKPYQATQAEPVNMDVTVTKRESNGDLIEQRKYIGLKKLASPEQFKKLADGLLNDNAPFSRREWSDKRKVFSQDSFIKLQTYCLDVENNLAVYNGNRVDATVDFLDFLDGYTTNPSPTPQSQPMEVVQNPAI